MDDDGSRAELVSLLIDLAMLAGIVAIAIVTKS